MGADQTLVADSVEKLNSFLGWGCYKEVIVIFHIIGVFFVVVFFFLGPHPQLMGSSQGRGRIGATVPTTPQP